MVAPFNPITSNLPPAVYGGNAAPGGLLSQTLSLPANTQAVTIELPATVSSPAPLTADLLPGLVQNGLQPQPPLLAQPQPGYMPLPQPAPLVIQAPQQPVAQPDVSTAFTQTAPPQLSPAPVPVVQAPQANPFQLTQQSESAQPAQPAQPVQQEIYTPSVVYVPVLRDSLVDPTQPVSVVVPPQLPVATAPQPTLPEVTATAPVVAEEPPKSAAKKELAVDTTESVVADDDTETSATPKGSDATDTADSTETAKDKTDTKTKDTSDTADASKTYGEQFVDRYDDKLIKLIDDNPGVQNLIQDLEESTDLDDFLANPGPQMEEWKSDFQKQRAYPWIKRGVLKRGWPANVAPAGWENTVAKAQQWLLKPADPELVSQARGLSTSSSLSDTIGGTGSSSKSSSASKAGTSRPKPRKTDKKKKSGNPVGRWNERRKLKKEHKGHNHADSYYDNLLKG